MLRMAGNLYKTGRSTLPWLVMVKLSKSEADFVNRMGVSRLASASLDGQPHVVPVSHALDGEFIYVATDYGTRKLRNLGENRKAALVVDEQGGVMIQGDAEILERGPEYTKALKVLFDRFEGYRNNPWGEGEAPIIRIRIKKVVSWGLG